MKNNNLHLLLVVGLAITLFSCGSGTNHSNHEHSETEEEMVLPTETTISKDQAQAIITGYLKIKDALVETNGGEASFAATDLLASLELDDPLAQKIKFDVQHISDTDDAQHQRDHFYTLSNHIYALAKISEGQEQPLYRQFCPMARDNKGAYWVSAQKEISNPYFGSQMLRCGSVKEEL